jgi:hypothetical protein
MDTKVVVKDDLIIGKHDGAFGLELPKDLSDVSVSNLRFLNGKFLDVSDWTNWFIDGSGVKHVVEGSGWQELECHFNDVLILDDGQWRVRKNVDDYDDLLAAALANRVEAYKAESDPLYIEWQYDQSEGGEVLWREKVARIKERYPLPVFEDDSE